MSATFLTKYCLPIKPLPITPVLPPWHNIPITVDTSLNVLTEKLRPLQNRNVALERFESIPDHCIKAYTDGSKHEELVGYGIYFPHNNLRISVRIPDYSDIFAAEAKAVEHCIHIMISNNVLESVIISDSLSVLIATRHDSTHPGISDIRIALQDAFQKGLTISLLWVPSHCGISGNEIADSLAKAALSMDDITEVQYSLNNHYAMIDKYIIQNWQADWSECSHPLSSVYANVKKQQYLFHKNSYKNSLVYSFALNCPKLNYYMSRYIPISPLCGYCPLAIEEDRDHFVFVCAHFDFVRDPLVVKLSSLNIPFTWKNLLFEPVACDAFIEFLISSGRFDG